MSENYKNNHLYLDKLESLPKNVRQIGEAMEGNRIYMEDYVYSYLNQYAAEKKTSEQIAFLIGKNYTYNDDVVVIIHGAVKGEHTEKVNGDLCITERTWYYVYEKIRRYFEDFSVIGWMYTQPGYGILLTSFLKDHHHKNFIDDKQLLYLIDPLEKEDSFFAITNGELQEKKGYYIYYDKNPAMHHYMLENKAIEEEKDNEKEVQEEKNVVRAFRRKEHERREDVYQKKFINMLTILCGGLVLICLLMGIGLLSNIEKLDELQTAMSTMTEKYNTIKEEVGSLESGQDMDTNGTLIPTQSIESTEAEQGEKTVNETPATNIRTAVEEPHVEDKPVSGATQDIEVEPEESKPVVEDKPEAVPAMATTALPKTTTISADNIPKSYKVKVGDSLNTISEKFYYSLDMVPAIQELNDIGNPNRIYVGQEILLPKP
ncbi:LysM peptidoglycan-binding domain-containing protein [Vallitalea pronyensis]|uniref:LysM peptidoglycan-binding domain-containing protein n=1 Tax=Vallitalea pronyensis TaxID=1348613 RepID=A0A8J8SF14_9FIRM|nr:LysM peptidoglycan-binding domain-containing protein [Vallitalea pronyensis]QUI20952.1 LysM peptidoglycan-binding domain-containing protein [Vallitalea pronyensis]